MYGFALVPLLSSLSYPFLFLSQVPSSLFFPICALIDGKMMGDLSSPPSPQRTAPFSRPKSSKKVSSRFPEIHQGIESIHDDASSSNPWSSIQSSRAADGNLQHSPLSLSWSSERGVPSPSFSSPQDIAQIRSSPTSYAGHPLVLSENAVPPLQSTPNSTWTKNMHPTPNGGTHSSRGNAGPSAVAEARMLPSSVSAPPTPLVRENTNATYGNPILDFTDVFPTPPGFLEKARNASLTASPMKISSYGSSSPMDRWKRGNDSLVAHETSSTSAIVTSTTESRNEAEDTKKEVGDLTDTSFPSSRRLPSNVAHGLRSSDAKAVEGEEGTSGGAQASAWYPPHKKDPHGDSLSPVQLGKVEGIAEGISERRCMKVDALGLDWNAGHKSPSQPILSARKASHARSPEERRGGNGSDAAIEGRKGKPVDTEREKYKQPMESGKREDDDKPQGKGVYSTLAGKVVVSTTPMYDRVPINIPPLPLSFSVPNSRPIESREECAEKHEQDSVRLVTEAEEEKINAPMKGAGKSTSSPRGSAQQEKQALPATLPVTQLTARRRKKRIISSTRFSSTMRPADSSLSSPSSLYSYRLSSTTLFSSPRENEKKEKRGSRVMQRKKRSINGEFCRESQTYWMQCFPWVIRLLIAVVVISLAHFCMTLLLYHAFISLSKFK